MNRKQINESKNKLETIIRQYIYGLQKPIMVKNQFNCLFVDIMLDMEDEQGMLKKRNTDFDKLLVEM
jgi:hypothetical protein